MRDGRLLRGCVKLWGRCSWPWQKLASHCIGAPCSHTTGALATGVAVPKADALAADMDAAQPPSKRAAGAAADAGDAAAANAAAAVALPLLRAVERLLPRLCPADRRPLLSAVSALTGGAGATAPAPPAARAPAVRAACLRLQRGLLLRHLREAGDAGDPEAAAEMAEWLRAAPKALWSMGDRSPASSQVGPACLHGAGC